jgi:hypothetical protein
VTIDVIEDLVCPSFSVQINGNAPSPSDGSGKKWDAQWTQFGLMMQSNSLALLNQAWHALGADTKGDPLASVTEVSATMLTLENNTVPAGTKIVLTLTLDSSDDNFSTAISGKIFQNGVAVGTPVNWPLIGQPTFNPGGPVKEADLSPLGAVSVVIVGPPGGTANFSSGMGTITVNCAPKLTVSSDLNGPNPHGIQTAEQSNCWYGQVQAGSFTQIVQPFGVLSPKITGIGGVNNVSGTGLYPNSTLKVTAFFSGSGYGETNGVVGELAPVAHDGSFGFGVTPQNPAANYNPGTLTVKVSDSVGNSVEGVVGAGGPGFPVVISSTGTPRQNW